MQKEGAVAVSSDSGFFTPTYGGGARKKNPYTIDGNKLDWVDKEFGTAVSAWSGYTKKPRLPNGKEDSDEELHKMYLKAMEFLSKLPKTPTTPTTPTAPTSGSGAGQSKVKEPKRAKDCPIPGTHSHAPFDSASTWNCHPVGQKHHQSLVARGAHKPEGTKEEIKPEGTEGVEEEQDTEQKVKQPSGYAVGQYEWREAEDEDNFKGYKISKKPGIKTLVNVDFEKSDDPASFTGAIMLNVNEAGKTSNHKYTAEQTGRTSALKFSRQDSFITDLEVARETLDKDIDDGVDEAAIIYLMEQTAFRIGRPGTKSKKKGKKVTSEDFDESGEKITYGASTILSKHVNVDGDSVVFNFPAKGGVQIPDKTIEDPKLAKIISDRLDKNKPEESLFKADHQQTRQYLQRTVGKEYILHDIRTLKATEKALEYVTGQETPTTKDEFDELVRGAAIAASDFLHNEPVMAMGTYVNHAAVFGPMMQNLGIEKIKLTKKKGEETGVSTERAKKEPKTVEAPPEGEVQQPASAPEKPKKQRTPRQEPTAQPKAAPKELPADVPDAPKGVTKETKARIKRFFDGGLSIRQIANKMEMPFEIVKPIIQRISDKYEAKDFPPL